MSELEIHTEIKHRQPRRGMAVIMVLLLLSLTMGLCYAAMRGQFTMNTIQRNSNRSASARQAAMTGMTLAIKKMHGADWGGVDSTYNGSLGAYESFLATFTAGDNELDSDDDQPYRVTIVATGYAVDPEHPQSIANYRVRTVLRLIPRQLAAQPSDWPDMQGYTVYQTKMEDVEIDIPCRFAGKVRFQKKLKFAVHYPNDSDARERYMEDLDAMRSAGWPDYRPFNGPIYLPSDEQESKYYNLLVYDLQVTVVDAPADEANSDWIKPTSLWNYRIYPGGPQYDVQPVSSSLSDVVLQPDPATNPLGLFYRDGSVTIYDNVTVEGSLFCKDDIYVRGDNLEIRAVDLPPLAGTSAPIRLAATSSQKNKVYDGQNRQITGLVAVFDEFKIEDGSDDTEYSLTGRLVTKKLEVQERNQWGSYNWGWYYDWFIMQLHWDPQDAVEYFPEFMSHFGLNPTPRLVFAPEASEVTYHWANGYDPIFVPHPDDGGLRWDVLKWSEEQ